MRGCNRALAAGLLALVGAGGCGLPRSFGVRDAEATGDVASDARPDAGGTDAGGMDADDGAVVLDAETIDVVVSDARDVQPPDDTGIPPIGTAGCPVAGVDTVAHIAVGDRFACAARCDGKVYCWGSNEYFQLGSVLPGGAQGTPTPTEVRGMYAYDIAAGAYHVCAIDSRRRVVCWGANTNRQLGVDSNGAGSDLSFQPVPGVTDAVALAANGGTTCAWTSAGELYCWGQNDRLQAGSASASPQPPARLELPAAQGYTPEWYSVSLGEYHGCALRAGSAGNSETFCWGDTFAGQTGVSGATGHQLPSRVTSATSFGAVMAGDLFTIGLELGTAMGARGAQYCWGRGQDGRCGDGSTAATDHPVPTQVTGNVFDTLARSSGYRVTHACGLLDGTAYCWGGNDRGQAHGGIMNAHEATPIALTSLGAVKEIAVGRQNTCALDSGGTVSCWGGAGSGVLGPNSRLDTGFDGDGRSTAYTTSEVRVSVPDT